MRNGVVRSVLTKKNFGFITSDFDRKDYFFHREDFLGHWTDLVIDFENDRKIEVQFQEDKTEKGLRARNVTRLDGGI